eukprot:12398272-Karenia_brevis.AAC.1
MLKCSVCDNCKKHRKEWATQGAPRRFWVGTRGAPGGHRLNFRGAPPNLASDPWYGTMGFYTSYAGESQPP